MSDKELIAEARGAFKATNASASLIARLADALEAATRVPVQGEPNDDREALARVMDTLAYYHCRSVNPKADHPRMGYHAMTEDQREHLREKQREAAEEIVRMLPSLSRAAVPDAATERARADSEWRDGTIISQLANAEAECDAALAAVERVRAIHRPTLPGYGPKACVHDGRAWPCPTVAALDELGGFEEEKK